MAGTVKRVVAKAVLKRKANRLHMAIFPEPLLSDEGASHPILNNLSRVC
ncbi:MULTISPECIES: hypothetical protein [Novosphingobium]|jgi:hypothetical protein|nr:hypothetical protein [Novosphingobium resinovorum]